MTDSNFRKKMTENWFSYLQNQICKDFESLEKSGKKFVKRDWFKKIRMKVAAHLSFYQMEKYLKK